MRRKSDRSKVARLFMVIDEVLIVLVSLLVFLYDGVTSSTAISNQSKRGVSSDTYMPSKACQSACRATSQNRGYYSKMEMITPQQDFTCAFPFEISEQVYRVIFQP